ncbi:pyrroline-5-carboxylate reductase [Paenibacillus sp. MMS18-CY102]|uniref:pyrroline-5-carboxylate reductase n=1 Tax=Paenibacillus sp. MMS18-CY102 TaxID=2682849 RepID=UPI001365B99F|nr:pyrroline-5-carboxylate reductase [Paenibacillus sp. MMS18-CY102]MWC28521.1 pyrroline-5-carboxylate reductase [Paenibacillus sp. MMS18-CY102]
MQPTTTLATLGSLSLCFYGAGSMAEAIVRGLIGQELTKPSQISMLNRQNVDRLQELTSRYGVETSSDETAKLAMIQSADVLFLAPKPKDAAAALEQLRPLLSPNQLIVSVIAGLSIRTIEQLLGQPMAVVRTMPNTSSTIGLGATGISYSNSVTADQRLLAEAMFQAVGLTSVVEEPLLDVVTGVSGSGPAYVYYLMEAMIKAGQELGLNADAARELTVQTVLGAAQMVKETGEQPADLRRKVTSPNGTTQAALETLDAHHFATGVERAVARAAERAGELGADIERSALK